MASVRKNISLDTEVLKTAEALWKERHERGLSMLVSNLIKEERRRRSSSSTAPRRPFEERAAEVVVTLTEDFKDYMAKCRRDGIETGGKSAMFESWALQRLAALVARGLELDERVTAIDGLNRR